MNTYTVRVAREGKWWMIRVPEIDGLTQARRFAEVEDMARSLIAMSLDVAEDSFGMYVELEAIEDVRVTEWIERIHDDEDRAEELRQAARTEKLTLAAALADKGVPVRDIGCLLDVSHQRAQQFIESARAREKI